MEEEAAQMNDPVLGDPAIRVHRELRRGALGFHPATPKTAFTPGREEGALRLHPETFVPG